MMRTFFPDYTSYPLSYPPLEAIDSCVFFSLSPRFWVLAAKKGEKIQISSHSVCGSFGSVFLFCLLFFFVLATVVVCTLLLLYEIKLLAYYSM